MFEYLIISSLEKLATPVTLITNARDASASKKPLGPSGGLCVTVYSLLCSYRDHKCNKYNFCCSSDRASPDWSGSYGEQAKPRLLEVEYPTFTNLGCYHFFYISIFSTGDVTTFFISRYFQQAMSQSRKPSSGTVSFVVLNTEIIFCYQTKLYRI